MVDTDLKLAPDIVTISHPLRRSIRLYAVFSNVFHQYITRFSIHTYQNYPLLEQSLL